MRTDDSPESYLDEPPQHGPDDIPDDARLHCDSCGVNSDQAHLYHIGGGDDQRMVCGPCRTGIVLSKPGLLTPPQAFAIAYRDVHGLSRKETAERYGHSPNVHDDAVAAARRKVNRARDTISLLEGAHDVVDQPDSPN